MERRNESEQGEEGVIAIPNRDSHNLLDFYYFGCKYEQFAWVHDLLDHGTNTGIDYQKIFGTKHRHFMHNAETIKWIEMNFGGFASLVARLHIAYDLVTSQEKRERTRHI